MIKKLFDRLGLKIFEFNENRKSVYLLSYEDEDYYRLKYDLGNINFVIEIDELSCYIYKVQNNQSIRQIQLDINDILRCRNDCQEIKKFFETYPNEMRNRKHKYQFHKDDYS